MGLTFWWMLLVWTLAIIGYWVVRFLLRHRQKPKRHAVPIAHSNHLTDLPEYKKAMKRYERLILTACGLLSISLLGAMIVTARPATVSYITPAQKGRDIMLCLDVSGSLLKVDTTIVNRFRTLIQSFSGQRFGLTVFNSSAVSVVPLTDDYVFLDEQLAEIGAALAKQEGNDFDRLTSGTLADFDKGTSLVSDGVASCVNNLGPNPLARSQSVIVATDNEKNGTAIISMEQAAAVAESNNVRIYAIDPGQSEEARDKDHQELQSLAQESGGAYYKLSDGKAIAGIIDEVSKQEAKYAASAPVIAVADTPKPFLYIVLVFTLLSLLVLWRLRL